MPPCRPVYSRSRWLNNTGHDSPAGTNPVFTSRVSGIVLPGLPPNTLVKSVRPWRATAAEYPARTVAWSGLPRIVRNQPSCTFGRHATPTLMDTLFQSVL